MTGTMITIRIPGALRRYTDNQASIQSSGETVSQALNSACIQFPDLKGQLFDASEQVRRFVNIYANEEDIRYLSGLDTPVSAGDVITLIPAIAGG